MRWIDDEPLDEPEERPGRLGDLKTTQGGSLGSVTRLCPPGIPSGFCMGARSNPSEGLTTGVAKMGVLMCHADVC